jgi:manganese/zinc/iron transport system permease protein
MSCRFNISSPRLLFLSLCAVSLACCCERASAAADRVAVGTEWQRLLLLQDYNTRVVVVGASLLGLAAGTIGNFTLLRRRALMGDALSHATLPGVGLAFLLGPLIGIDGKSLPLLLAGAAVSGLAGVGVIVFIRRLTRLKEDAALGIVLSVFFGAGVAILSVAQQTTTGHAAGLESFIYGKTASMVASDAWLIGISGAVCVGIVLLLFKEFCLLCFDDGFAGAEGFQVTRLDMLLMTLVVFVTIIGLQAVGLILMIALLVIPSAAARFWTHQLKTMTWIAAAIGGISGLIGAAATAVLPDLPSGAMIVLVCGTLFLVSMLLGTARGVIARTLRRHALNRKIDRDHLLRGLYESLESIGRSLTAKQAPDSPVTVQQLESIRSWSPRRLKRQIHRSIHDGHVVASASGLQVTQAGFSEAERLVHEHRLWELYLITHAEVAPGHVDMSADTIEHVLEPEMIDRLEVLLERHRAVEGIANSPHPILHSEDAQDSHAVFEQQQGSNLPDRHGGAD